MPRRAWLILATVALASFANNLLHVPRTGFNPDESRWLSRAHFAREAFDPFGPTWADRYATRGQPPVGSYVTGLGLLVQGRDLFTNLPWEFSYAGTPGWRRNMAEGRMPAADDLSAARRTSAALVALAAAAVAAVGWLIGGAPAAAIAGGAFAAHPFNAYVGSLATADAGFALLLALAGVAGAAYAVRPGWPLALGLGALLGLGGGAKLSPLLVAPVVGLFGAAAIVLARRREPATARWARPLVFVPLFAAVTFVASYPYLWPDPVGRTANLVAFRAGEMQAQASDWPVMAVPTRVEALRRVGVNFDERYSLLGGLRAATAPVGGDGVRLPALDLAAATAGALLWCRIALRSGPRSPAALSLLVLGSQVAVTVGGMRSEFDRYHVPLAIVGAVALGVLAAALWRTAAPLGARWASGG